MRPRKVGDERKKDGSLVANPQRVGPLTLEARLKGLDTVLDIQNKINVEAARLGRPLVDILNGEEESRIRELISLNTWPEGWDGTEPNGSTMMDRIFPDGLVQPLLQDLL